MSAGSAPSVTDAILEDLGMPFDHTDMFLVPCHICRREMAPDAALHCGGCKCVAYCGPECQLLHWRNKMPGEDKTHREACREFRSSSKELAGSIVLKTALVDLARGFNRYLKANAGILGEGWVASTVPSKLISTLQVAHRLTQVATRSPGKGLRDFMRVCVWPVFLYAVKALSSSSYLKPDSAYTTMVANVCLGDAHARFYFIRSAGAHRPADAAEPEIHLSVPLGQPGHNAATWMLSEADALAKEESATRMRAEADGRVRHGARGDSVSLDMTETARQIKHGARFAQVHKGLRAIFFGGRLD